MTINFTHLTTGGAIVIYTDDDGTDATQRAWVRTTVLEHSAMLKLTDVMEMDDRINHCNSP